MEGVGAHLATLEKGGVPKDLPPANSNRRPRPFIDALPDTTVKANQVQLQSIT